MVSEDQKVCPACNGDKKARAIVGGRLRIVSVYNCTDDVRCALCYDQEKAKIKPVAEPTTDD